MSTRRALIAIAVAFAIFEIVDIPDTGAPAAVFAALFLAGALWIWRRQARLPAVFVGLLLAVEATQAQTWKDASLAARDFAMVAGSIGLVVVGAYLAASKHARLAGALAAAVAILAVSAGAAQAATATHTLQFVNVQQTFTMQPNGGPAVGSRMFFTSAIYNRVPQFGRPAGARVGRTEVVCTVVSRSTAQCMITAHVPNGQIVSAGAMALRRGPATSYFGIIGGAGAYGGVRGTVLSKDVSETKSYVVLKLAA